MAPGYTPCFMNSPPGPRGRAAALAEAGGGRLAGRAGKVSLALSAERLQAEVDREGVRGVAVWGSGPVGDVLFEPAVPAEAELTLLPNRAEFAWPGGALTVTALPRTPAVVFEASGDAPRLRLRPYSQALPGFAAAARLEPLAGRWRTISEWAAAELGGSGAASLPGGRVAFGDSGTVALVVGADIAEVAAGGRTLALSGGTAEHRDYVERVTGVFSSGDLELDGLFAACLHAALACYKRLPDGRFGGFSAGNSYSVPPRTYYRDSYWTLQALLPLWPELAREQLLLLAGGVHDDGEAPSGVMTASRAGERVWRARLAADPALASDHAREGEWWSDHFDSPFYFVLLAHDVARWTRSTDLVEERVGGRSVAELVRAVLRRAAASAPDGVLPAKPDHDRDWADNVFRSGYVTYDVGLYHGALLAAASLFERAAPREAAGYRERAAEVRSAASARLYREDLGHFVEFVRLDGSGEERLALDSLTALRFGLASRGQALATLSAIGSTLETRHNHAQPHGDWGVMCGYPAYGRGTRLRGKSAFPLRYHNGSDWPYLDGIYAEALMAAGAPGWRYPLTRWRQHSLARGWPTPVEYYAPPWGRGSPLNGWSAMPAAAMLLAGLGLEPGSAAAKAPPWGDCEVRGVRLAGARFGVSVRGGEVSVTSD